MPIIAGVDGCPGGWICVTRDTVTGQVGHGLYANAGALLAQTPHPLVLTIDIPIGLTNAGPRACDTAARALLGEPRRRSVFPAPIRPALTAATRQQASDITLAADGRGVGAQSWAIYPKILDVDHAITPAIQQWCFEIHPELCFRAWNNGVALSNVKSTPQGRIERETLIAVVFGQARDQVRAGYPRRQVADDDINDAFAALWTAERVTTGVASTIPAVVPVDAVGLRMEMRY